MDSKIRSYLGLCTKAGGLSSGEFSVLANIRDGKAKLVIVASDAALNTKKKFTDKCNYYKVPIIIYSNKEELSKILGQKQRSCISIVNTDFYKVIATRFEEIL